MPVDSSANDQDATLRAWCAALLEDGVDVDIDAVLALAGQVAHAVVRPAAPLTSFVVGYAAGRAAERTGVSDAEAFAAAAAAAAGLARDSTFGSMP